MRSFDLTMPEERNRIATDQLSDLLLCSSDTSAENLRSEGISGKVEVVGDVMVDVALRWQPSGAGENSRTWPKTLVYNRMNTCWSRHTERVTSTIPRVLRS